MAVADERSFTRVAARLGTTTRCWRWVKTAVQIMCFAAVTFTMLR